MYSSTGTGLSISQGRVLVLGDSITQDGRYATYIADFLGRQLPPAGVEMIARGLNSETVSGLSEPEHPFPRPCLHSRLQPLLAELRPDFVTLCYGMNDGIYYPFCQEYFTAYQNGIKKAVETVQQAGARAVLLTPPPFDPVSFGASGHRLEDEGCASYSYLRVYRDYDQVLSAFARWLLAGEAGADAVIDLRTPLCRWMDTRRQSDPAYSTGDGIHPNADGHREIAKAVLQGLFGISSCSLADSPRAAGQKI